MTPEGKVKEQVKRLFKKYNVWYTMPMGTGMGRGGIPDFLACIPVASPDGGITGQFLAVETKAGYGKVTALQEKELQAINLAGGVAMVVNEKSLHLLEQLLVLRTTTPKVH